MDDQDLLVIWDSTAIDVLDENLYNYDNAVFTLMPLMRDRASHGLLRKVEQFIASVPAIRKAANSAKKKTEYVPLIADEIKKLLQEGKAEIIPCKNNSNAFFLQVRSTVQGLVVHGKEYGINKKIRDIPLSAKSIPADITGAMQCLSMQSQLNQITTGLKEISEACEFNFGRIIQGQRDDRIAKLLSSRSCYIQALAITDEDLKRQMLIQAIRNANSARAELAFQIKSDIVLLGGEKTPKAKDMEKIVCDVNTAIAAINSAVQLSLYSYQILGEHNAQLSVVKEHETFIKQILLKEIEYKNNKHIAWNVICSSGNYESVPQDFEMLPTKLINSCTAFIEGKNENLAMQMEVELDD